MLLVIGDADGCDQQNTLCWEHVDPPWVLPNYISKLAQALQATKAWIMTGGVANSATMVTTVPAPTDNVDEGKSEAPGLYGVPQVKLLTPCWLVLKVLQ